jgi:thioredoxin reductase (NADPH)
MALGRVSAINFATKLGIKTENNDIVIDRDGKTDVEGVYAGGTCTGGNAQAANSVGEGCNAAMSVIKKLKGVGNYIDYS